MWGRSYLCNSAINNVNETEPLTLKPVTRTSTLLLLKHLRVGCLFVRAAFLVEVETDVFTQTKSHFPSLFVFHYCKTVMFMRTSLKIKNGIYWWFVKCKTLVLDLCLCYRRMNLDRIHSILIHPKMKIISSFTHPHDISNLFV